LALIQKQLYGSVFGMSFFESLNGSAVMLHDTPSDQSTHDYLRNNLQTLYPDSSRRIIKEVLARASDAAEEALTGQYESDRLGRLVMIGSAVATFSQGWEGRFGRWKSALVPKGADPTLFWQTRTRQRVASKVIQSAEFEDVFEDTAVESLSSKDVLLRYAQKNPDVVTTAMSEIVDEFGSPGGLYEGMEPVLGNVYTLYIDDVQAEQLEAELQALGDTNSIDTSWHFGDGDILLGRRTSHALHDGSDELTPFGTLAHEIAHGYTAHLTKYLIQGHQERASVLTEVLAEHGRAHLSYPSSAYASERAFQWAFNDTAGYDVLYGLLQTKGQGEDAGLAYQYARHAIEAGGIVFAALALGAIPANYLKHDNTNFSGHDIALLESSKYQKRYAVLRHYLPESARPIMEHMIGSDGLWHKPIGFDEVIRRMIYSFPDKPKRFRLL